MTLPNLKHYTREKNYIRICNQNEYKYLNSLKKLNESKDSKFIDKNPLFSNANKTIDFSTIAKFRSNMNSDSKEEIKTEIKNVNPNLKNVQAKDRIPLKLNYNLVEK